MILYIVIKIDNNPVSFIPKQRILQILTIYNLIPHNIFLKDLQLPLTQYIT